MRTLFILGAVALFIAACDRDAGRGQQTVGRLEAGVGSIVGDGHLKREGKKDEVVGGVKAGDLKGALKDATH